MRKPAFCICENKDADQLRGNREADQRVCFRYTDSTMPLLPKSEISSLYPFSVAVEPGLCGTWSETRRPVFSQRGSFNNLRRATSTSLLEKVTQFSSVLSQNICGSAREKCLVNFTLGIKFLFSIC